MSRRHALGLAAPAAAAGLLAGQALVARRREYLPRDPGYRVDGVTEPAAGGGGGRGGRAAELRLAVLGDSTVAGVGSPTAEESLALLVAERVAGATGRVVAVTGFGVSGARTGDLADSQLPDALAGQPHVLVAVAGSNDVTHVTPPWRLRRAITELVAATRAATSAPLVLAGIPRFARIDALMEPLGTVADAYARVLRDVQRGACASLGVPFVEIARDASPRFAGVPEAMSPDGFHPGPVGYGFWADAIAPVVVQALARADAPPERTPE